MRTTVAFILLFAAVAKGWAVYSTNRPWMSADTTAAIQIAGESALALWLLSRLLINTSHYIALVTFLFFAIYTIYMAFAGAKKCGCFGSLDTSPWYALGLDLTVVAGLIGFPPPSLPPDGARRLLLPRAAGVFLASATALITYGVSGGGSLTPTPAPGAFGRPEVLEPGAWVGRRFPLLPHLASSSDLSTHHWVVVLHRPGCSSCREIHTEFEALGLELGRRTDGLRVAFVEVPWAEAGAAAPLKSHDLYAVGRLADDRKWFVETPLILELQDGMVVSVIERPGPGSANRFRPPSR